MEIKSFIFQGNFSGSWLFFGNICKSCIELPAYSSSLSPSFRFNWHPTHLDHTAGHRAHLGSNRTVPFRLGGRQGSHALGHLRPVGAAQHAKKKKLKFTFFWWNLMCTCIICFVIDCFLVEFCVLSSNTSSVIQFVFLLYNKLLVNLSNLPPVLEQDHRSADPVLTVPEWSPVPLPNIQDKLWDHGHLDLHLQTFPGASGHSDLMGLLWHPHGHRCLPWG